MKRTRSGMYVYEIPYSTIVRSSPMPKRISGLDDEGKTADTIHVRERDDMEDTGLLDADGNRLYRVRDPIGFKAS